MAYKLHILGTVGYHPIEERHTLSAIIPELGFVLDAGTGFFRARRLIETRQLHIFITHLHLDHCIGLTYLRDVTYLKDVDQITIYGPENLPEINKLFGGSFFPLKLPSGTKLKVADPVFKVGDIEVRSMPLKHLGPAVGYRFSLPSFELAYITDTAVDESYFELARGADLLIHECNFPSDMTDVAIKSGHTDTASFLAMKKVVAPTKALATHFCALDEKINQRIYGELVNGDPDILGAEEKMKISLERDNVQVLH